VACQTSAPPQDSCDGDGDDYVEDLPVDGGEHPPYLLPPADVAADAGGVIRRADGTPWDAWQIEGFGKIVYDATSDSLGAHCSLTETHGCLCRANKVCKRLGLGYLVAWLRAPHQDGSLTTKASHKEMQGNLCSEAGLDARRAGRKFLLDREVVFRGLLDLERRFNPSLEEPVKVRAR
jgi:hypothetical protein